MNPSETASEALRDRRLENKSRQAKNIAEVYAKVPEIKELDRQIRSLGFSLTQDALKGKATAIGEEKIRQLNLKRKNLLLKTGFPQDYMDLHYHCNKCKDTGFVGNEMCSCRRQIIIEEKYSRSNIKNLLKSENFRTFDLDLFSKNPDPGHGGVSPYENMEFNVKNVKAYIRNFDQAAKNLYIYGDVGRGKTFLVNCIAKEILDRNFSVLYFTSTRLFSFMNEYFYAFSERKEDLKKDYDFLMDADLLIIDDLGAEKYRESDEANLFDLVNTRIIKGLPIIFSSNYNPDHMREYYGERIFSRIMGTSEIYEVYGEDLRIKLR